MTGRVLTGWTAPAFSGFKPRKLNTFEESICEAWGCDPLAVYTAVDAWMRLAAQESMFNPRVLVVEAWESVVIPNRKRRTSPIAVCNDLRGFLEDKELRPD